MLKRASLLLAILWSLISIYLFLSSSSSLSINIDVKNGDKYFHAAFHAFFVILWYLGLKTRALQDPIKKLLIPLVGISIFYGISIEIAQYAFTKSRSADFFDILANCSGALIAFVLLLAYEKWGHKSVL